METVRQLQDYCRENNIRGYSKLRKSELIQLIQSQQRVSENVFQFHDDLFSEPKKEREAKVKCCDQYYKKSYMAKHLQSKKHQSYEKANVFSFDASLFPKPKKERTPQIKCSDCGTYYKPALKGHHLRSIKHRRAVDPKPKAPNLRNLPISL
ncbi:rho_N domain-containing protein [Trichonephila clavipes]|nr:rho_N domain-containing protein [Trichonephila clavipes]